MGCLEPPDCGDGGRLEGWRRILCAPTWPTDHSVQSLARVLRRQRCIDIEVGGSKGDSVSVSSQMASSTDSRPLLCFSTTAPDLCLSLDRATGLLLLLSREQQACKRAYCYARPASPNTTNGVSAHAAPPHLGRGSKFAKCQASRYTLQTNQIRLSFPILCAPADSLTCTHPSMT